jgi:GntR family transcriptional regulator, transcriptional repressor for pyruvate dehydrogenase complex
MAVFKKQKPINLVDSLVVQLENTILSGNFKPGERLPQSAELETALGVSRGTLREAIRILQQKGLVESRVGVKGGVFVREANTDSVTNGIGQLMRRKKISIGDLSEFRQVIEAGLIRSVAKRIAAQDIKSLKKFLPALEKEAQRGAAGWDGFLDIEVMLRKELVCISGNPLYEAVLTPIHENIFSYAAYYITGEDANVEEALDDWTQIIEALATGDVERSVNYTCEHIRRYANRMEQGMAKVTKNDL